MILLTSGFPQSGKTEFSRKLTSKISDAIHVDPKDLYLKEFDSLPGKMQSAVAISAWEMALEQAYDHLMDEPNSTLIIFDTCCSNENTMRALFTNARYHKHDVLYVFVEALQEDRYSRASNMDTSQYESKYKSDFIRVLPVFKKLSDQFIRVTNNNDGGFEELDKCVEMIAQDVEKTRSG